MRAGTVSFIQVCRYLLQVKEEEIDKREGKGLKVEKYKTRILRKSGQWGDLK